MGSVDDAENPAFDVRFLFGAARQYWWLGILIAFLFIGASVALAFILTPIYRAEVLMAQADDEANVGLSQLMGGLGGVAAIAGLDLGGRGNIEVYLAMLNSHSFTEAFIRDNSLMQEIFRERWDAKNARWADPEDPPTMFEAVRAFDRSIRSVSRDRRTGLIRVAIEWRDRHKAATWANELISRVNEAARAQAIEEANRSIAYLNKELVKTNVVELQQAIYRLIESQMNRIMGANIRQEYAFKVIDPATAPDAKHKVRPKRLFIVVAGGFVGGMAGIAAAILAMYFRNRKLAMASEGSKQ